LHQLTQRDISGLALIAPATESLRHDKESPLAGAERETGLVVRRGDGRRNGFSLIGEAVNFVNCEKHQASREALG